MSNVIRFLETLGSNPARLSVAEYAAAVAALDVGDTERQALMDRDHVALNDLLGGREKMLCLVWPSDEPVKEDDQSGDEQPVEDTPPDQE